MGLGFGRDHEAEVPRREAGPTPAVAGGKSIDQRKPPEPATGSLSLRENFGSKPSGDGRAKHRSRGLLAYAGGFP